ncbi:bifunctional DNA primase/polymerase [Cellulophaga phage Calle_1]|uniref:Bifunctional DNA primase/polymerase n=1 Tax=Cellulophaga phage Calle_1 TaxID=2745643 RepID=A0A8E4ZDV3_9CAUD|nr:DNA polymerase/primase [Cellulophaga phage Calle_1]QQV89745.1 bifunctional DNA primase/polymerase [Cellulophaga phage Calle_1]QQV89844.1 bifunctional DNA primase/polymerase [Cellulophaga phage Calle_2]QQV89875.1 bifunctional DNA primase/polymerase [Cellulophaga phage Calle_3]
MAYRETAESYLKAGLNPVPLNKGDKIPNISGWGLPIGEDLSGFDFQEIGVCTGSVSGGLEVLDMDLDVLENQDEVWEDWKSKIPDNILRKLVVAKTKSGGYHLMYRTSVVEGNQKLASKANKDVIMETRGQGGYIKCYPSEGYEIIYGDILDIQFIENYERNVLITTCKTYDERIREKKTFYGDGEFKDPFPKYNEDPDIGLDILEEAGWEVLREDANWVYLRRPDKQRYGVSATYNLDGNFLYVFSTSTGFDTEKPYSNSAIYSIINADGDFAKGYRQLRKMGYGVDLPKEDEDEDDTDYSDLSFISWAGEDEEKLDQYISGDIPLGLSFGWPDLDPYYVFKEKTLNFVLAFEGVGKTFMVLHKLVGLSVLYGKKFAICCGENDVGTVKRYLLEALCGKQISYYKGRDKELQVFKDFMYSHFFIFKNEEFFSVEDILKRAEVLNKFHNLDGLFIDPFSYFKKPAANTYNYNDDLLSRLNIYSKKIMAVFMSVHPNTEAARAPRDQDGYLKAPYHYDAIGGNMFANRCDGFLVYHRITNHKVDALKRMMDIRSAKIKDYDTGGSITPASESTALSYKTVDGFRGYFDSSNRNPMYESLKKQGIVTEEKVIPKKTAEDAFGDDTKPIVRPF